jgi:predicted nucleic acid-binding protein
LRAAVPYWSCLTRVSTESSVDALIAWKPAREATRAALDALPLLKDAEQAQILEVKQSADASLTPDTSIAAALGRHGIKPILRSTMAPDSKVGDVYFAFALSRFRRVIFGS